MSQFRNSPVDPDVDVHDGRQIGGSKTRPWRVGLAASGGGALGALARWLIGSRWAASTTGFPLGTLLINAAGCFLIGVLMVLIERMTAQWYLRPFLGVGVLGGFTTFSTYSVEVAQRLVDAPGMSLLYFAATPVAALLAVIVGVLAATGGLRLLGGLSKGGRA